jgi:uncharacterized lipoprotein YajG
MRGGICPTIIIAAACALLAACAPPPTPVRALPPGATPEEIADYARALAQYRAARASGNGDVAMQAVDTWSSIAQEILSRQDPGLFEAHMVCERYRVAEPQDSPDVRSTFAPQFVRDCQHIDWRYNQATSAIRRDLEERIAAADLARVAQARAGRP